MARADTICALSSGSLPSAIALIRLSGPLVRELADLHLKRGCPPARHARLDYFLDSAGSGIDQGVALFFAAPASYTGEDMLELSLHGGLAIVEDVLAVLTGHDGVRLAEPGEFTRRALEAGKLDLTEAEAVADLVEAETRAQRQQALRQHDGAMSRTLEDWRQALIDALALIEVAVDFPDEADAPDYTHAEALARIRPLTQALRAQLADRQIGEQVREGFRLALIGPPNAGKSSLMNALAGRDAAIVTDIPGTTRDVIEVRLDLAGHLVRVFDTAGLRDARDPVEKEGVRRARLAAEQADLRLLVLDAAAPATAETQALVDALDADDLVILNKTDLGAATDTESVSRETLRISAKTGSGLERLTERLATDIAQRVAGAPPPLITRARHRSALALALDHLEAAAEGLHASAAPELVAEDVRRAIRALDSLVGRIDVEDILGAVFSRFCIGK